MSKHDHDFNELDVGTLVYMKPTLRKRAGYRRKDISSSVAIVASPLQTTYYGLRSGYTMGQRLYIAERNRYELWSPTDLEKYWTTEEKK